MKYVNVIQPVFPKRYRQCSVKSSLPFLHLVAYMDLQTCDKQGPVFRTKVKISYQIIRDGKQSSLMFLDNFNWKYSFGVPLFPFYSYLNLYIPM